MTSRSMTTPLAVGSRDDEDPSGESTEKMAGRAIPLTRSTLGLSEHPPLGSDATGPGRGLRLQTSTGSSGNRTRDTPQL